MTNKHDALLTGVSGFIGRHLYQELLARHARVDVCARPSAITSFVDASRGSVWHHPLHALPDQCMTNRVIYHLAGVAHAGARASGADAKDALWAFNVTQTQAMFARALHHGAERFVWMSSVKVLGEASTHPLGVDAPLRPEGAYAESKAAAESALLDYAARQNAEHRLCIVRTPLVYGAGVKANFLSLLTWALRGWPLPLARVESLRSWLGVANLTAALGMLGNLPSATDITDIANTTSTARRVVWHVSDNDDLSVAAMLQHIAQAGGVRLPLFAVSPALLRNVARISGRSATAQRLLGALQLDVSETVRLGWQPGQSVSEGISEVVNWYRKQHS